MRVAASSPTLETVRPKVVLLDREQAEKDLDARGFAVIRQFLTEQKCRETARLYGRNEAFRSRVIMASHGYGRGEYKYFSYPLPALIADLRTQMFPWLAGIANRWNHILGLNEHYPDDHAAFLERCHEAGQTRPTPLLLEYGPGDYNCLHQDIYGDLIFPLQVAVLLSRPGADFTGGEFILTEQRPRMQSKASVVPLHQGDAVVFPVHHRPMRGTRGSHRVNMRHGVSEVRSGQRHTLGLIFHDAR